MSAAATGRQLNPLLEAALGYAARGWRVVPLYFIREDGVCSCMTPKKVEQGKKCDRSAGKHPCINEWGQLASVRSEQVRSWWGKWPRANVGVAMGQETGLWAFDVDGDEGLADLAALEADNSPLPRTVTQRTGGGGLQYLFRWPSDGTVITSGTHVEQRPLDTRGRGGQSVLPPSVSGKGRYQWAVSPDGAEPVEAPAWLVDWLRENKRAEGGPHQGNGKGSSPRGMRMKATRNWTVEERAVAYLKKCEPAVSGQRGHDKTFSVARAVVWGFDLGRDVGFELLRDHYNPSCLPPWDEDELRHKCADADTKPFDKPRGYMLKDRDSASAGGAGGPGTARQPQQASGDEVGFLTDLGNGRRLARRLADEARFCHPWGKWLTFDDRRWKEDDTGRLALEAKGCVLDLLQWAAAELKKAAAEAKEDGE